MLQKVLKSLALYCVCIVYVSCASLHSPFFVDIDGGKTTPRGMLT